MLEYVGGHNGAVRETLSSGHIKEVTLFGLFILLLQGNLEMVL